LIPTLLITILSEGGVVAGYCLYHKKPVRPVFLTSLLGNLITQSLLWVVLNIFFQYYLITLFVAEMLIWLMESVLLYSVPTNRLLFKHALVLSLLMNLTSFAFGWFLPA
jgi:hypothetical protein